MMKIAHTADIHIRLLKREEEYRNVFENFYESLRKNKPDRIVICGDLVHSKISLSPECISMTSDFLKALSEITNVDIILGNHDLLLTNKKRLDAISPIVKNINSNKIYLYTKSNFEVINEDLAYGIFSIVDQDNYPINFNRKGIKNYIALYHGMIEGAKFENDYISKNVDNKLDIFKNYDAAFLGDIHKAQELKKNVLYSGDLIQQNYAEELYKGYFLWTIDDNITHKFIPINNKYGFHTIDRTNHVFQDNQMSELPSIRIITDNISVSEQKKIIQDIRETYNNVQEIVFKIKESESEKLVMQERLDVSSEENIEKLLIEYFKNLKVDDNMINRILTINKEIYYQVPDTLINQNSIWNLKKLEFSNWFSYGKNNEIDFDCLRGIVGIFASNRSGKSSIISTILQTITGKNDKYKNGYDIINNKEKDCVASVYISQAENDYKITRRIEKGEKRSSRTRLNLYKLNDDNEYVETNEVDKNNTEKILRKMFGSYEDLILTSFGLQGKITNFIERTTGESYKIKVFSKFLGLDIFDEMFTIVKEEVSEVESMIKVSKKIDYSKQIIENKRELNNDIQELNELEEDSRIINESISVLEHEVIELKSKIGYNEYDFDIDDKIENIQTKLSNNKTELNKIIITKDDLIIKIDKIENELKIKNKTDILNNINDLEKLIEEYNDKNALYESKKSLLLNDDKQLDILDKQPWVFNEDLCSKCDFFNLAFDKQSTIKALKSELFDLKQFLDSNANLKNDISSKRKELNRINDLEQLKASIHNNILDNNIKKSKIDFELDKLIDELSALRDLKDKSIEKFEDNKKLVSLTNNLNKQKNSLRDKQNEIINLKSNVKLRENNSKIYEDNINKLSELEKEYEAYKLYKEAINKDGIPYYILSKSINIINEQINAILENFVNFRLRIETDDKEKDLSIMIVYEDGHDAPVEGASGMEKTISSIAIRAALVKISNLPKCNIFVLDEFASTLDSKYIMSIESMLNYLKNMFDIVLLITHSQEIMDTADSQINILKENEYSRIIVS